jgi:hypothetical protein
MARSSSPGIGCSADRKPLGRSTHRRTSNSQSTLGADLAAMDAAGRMPARASAVALSACQWGRDVNRRHRSTRARPASTRTQSTTTTIDAVSTSLAVASSSGEQLLPSIIDSARISMAANARERQRSTRLCRGYLSLAQKKGPLLQATLNRAKRNSYYLIGAGASGRPNL